MVITTVNKNSLNFLSRIINLLSFSARTRTFPSDYNPYWVYFHPFPIKNLKRHYLILNWPYYRGNSEIEGAVVRIILSRKETKRSLLRHPWGDPTDRVWYNRKTYWWRWRLSAVMGCSLVVLVFQENCCCYLRLFAIYSVRFPGKFIKGNDFCDLFRWPVDNRIAGNSSELCDKFPVVFYFSILFECIRSNETCGLFNIIKKTFEI